MSLRRKERDLKLALEEMRRSLPASENASEKSIGGSIGGRLQRRSAGIPLLPSSVYCSRSLDAAAITFTGKRPPCHFFPSLVFRGRKGAVRLGAPAHIMGGEPASITAALLLGWKKRRKNSLFSLSLPQFEKKERT